MTLDLMKNVIVLAVEFESLWTVIINTLKNGNLDLAILYNFTKKLYNTNFHKLISQGIIVPLILLAIVLS